MENLDEGIITLDREGRITYVNSRAQVLLKLKNVSILSKTVQEVVGQIEGLLAGEVERLIYEVKTRKERVRSFVTLNEINKIYLEVVVIPSEDDHGFVILLQDRSNEQKMIAMGKEFIANASHELRTPVTIIRGFAETLKDLPEVSEEMFDSILEKIIRNCERMEVLVKNLLTLADLDNTSQCNMKECDLISIVETACQTLLNVYPCIQIEQLQNQDEVLLWGDAGLLELAFFNLLKNGVKYSSAPADLKITIDAGENEVEISFADQGIGIAEIELTKIFDRFYTVDKTHSRKLGGAGLGLSIVKIIVEKHEGKIWATSQLGVGSTFHILFPRI